jgi:hypothetical protein
MNWKLPWPIPRSYPCHFLKMRENYRRLSPLLGQILAKCVTCITAAFSDFPKI